MELARYDIDIAAPFETRLGDENQLTETGTGYTFIWNGNTKGENWVVGVGFAIRTESTHNIERLNGFSDRLR